MIKIRYGKVKEFEGEFVKLKLVFTNPLLIQKSLPELDLKHATDNGKIEEWLRGREKFVAVAYDKPLSDEEPAKNFVITVHTRIPHHVSLIDKLLHHEHENEEKFRVNATTIEEFIEQHPIPGFILIGAAGNGTYVRDAEQITGRYMEQQT